jgi:mannose/fructose-specific phosphotransferase system component IIA
MTGVVVVTHGRSGKAMLDAAEKVVGRLDGVAFVPVSPGDPVDEVERRIEKAVIGLGTRDIVFLVDLPGSTPSNLCCHSHVTRGVVVSGMNLAMLFKLSTADRAREPLSLAQELAATGKKSIQVTS